MTDKAEAERKRLSDSLAATRQELPAGYRPGVITAITVFLGFSLLFLRYWGFEADGVWDVSSILATGLLTLSILLQVYTLWRALQVADDDVPVYAVTLRWFLSAILILLASVIVAGLSFSKVLLF